MVNVSKTDHEAIAKAIAAVEQRTSAQLAVVVAPASDAYLSYTLLYGFMLGTLIDSVLWAEHALTAFPWLLTIQVAAMVLLTFMPWLRRICVSWVPRRVRYNRAAHRAYEEYQKLSHHVTPGVPFVLLYISLGERYAHMLANHAVRAHIPRERWNEVIAALTAEMQREGLRAAVDQAIAHAAELLAAAFPKS